MIILDLYSALISITLEKKSEIVTVKRQDDFNKLLAVKISESIEFEARIIVRKDMNKGEGKFAKASWSSMKIRDFRMKPNNVHDSDEQSDL